MTITELEEIHDQFLYRWPIEKLHTLTIDEYVGLGNKDTFCQWIETKTRMLGSIKGLTSIKFGIYERNPTAKRPINYKNDEKYSWLKAYNDNSADEAFKKIKADILSIALLAEAGKFHQISDIKLPDLFKWKIAFLYSNERIIPIFRREVLFKIANHFGLITNDPKRISEIHELMISKKPANLNIYHFMWRLYDQFGRDKKNLSIENQKVETHGQKTKKASLKRNTNDQLRTVYRSYIAEQKHNKLQLILQNRLINKFGKENVFLEENFVDVKLVQPEHIVLYEVKSSAYASQCVRDALGQLLQYSHNDLDIRPKKHIVVGQYPATDNDLKYIKFVKDNLKVDFDYHHIDLI